MNIVLTVFGILSVPLLGMMFYYTLSTLKAFRKNHEVAATKLVLDDDVPKGFGALSASAIIFSALSFIGVVSLAINSRDLSYLTEAGGISVILGFIYFLRTVSKAVNEEE